MAGSPVPQRYEIPFTTKSGQERWLDLSAQRVDFEGQPAVLATCVDVTEKKQIEKQLDLLMT